MMRRVDPTCKSSLALDIYRSSRGRPTNFSGKDRSQREAATSGRRIRSTSIGRLNKS